MHRYPHWPIHLILGTVGILMLVPFVWVLKTSLTGENIFSYPPAILPQNPHLYHYVDVWYTIPFFRYLVNSVIVSAMVVAANIVFNAMAGYALSREFLGKRTIIMLFLSSIPLRTASIFPSARSKNLCILLMVTSLFFRNAFPLLVIEYTFFSFFCDAVTYPTSSRYCSVG
jgi:ABC-type glycerol-3-phosphate transport system permease component